MSSPQLVLLRYHEIALKGENRDRFEAKLASNTRKLIKAVHGDQVALNVTRGHSRIVLEAPWDDATRTALSRAFGLASFSPIEKFETSLEVIDEAVLQSVKKYIQEKGAPATFCVRTRRSDKVFGMTSEQLNRRWGAMIQQKFESAPGRLQVQLQDPAFTLGVELHRSVSYLSWQNHAGPGGLPVGVNSPVLSLLSGGIDSPVAAISVLRRGAPSGFVHFWGAPFVGQEVIDKVEELARAVNRFQPAPGPLWIVPFGKFQEQIAIKAPAKVRTLLYRRLMLKIASAIAIKHRFKALVTGEALGQVASQTVENMAAVDHACDELPILRPLIGYDKDEIVAKAKIWNTYTTSIQPGTDCCTLFADRHPALSADRAELEAIEAELPIAEWVAQACETAEKRWP